MFRRALFLTLVLLPVALPAAEGPGAAPAEISDQTIDEMKLKTKEALARKIAEIEKAHADREAFAKFLKDQRVAFEKQLSEDLVAFLTTLKTLPATDRRKALSDFSDKQRAGREEFTRQSRSKIDDFRRRNADAN
jgi:hypothetical protein